MSSLSKRVAAWFALLFIATTGCEALCLNTIEYEVVSPAGDYKAVVFRRGCGPMTGSSTQVMLLGVADSMPNTYGNVLVLGMEDDVRVEWSGDTLVVTLRTPTIIDFQADEALETPVRYVRIES